MSAIRHFTVLELLLINAIAHTQNRYSKTEDIFHTHDIYEDKQFFMSAMHRAVIQEQNNPQGYVLLIDGNDNNIRFDNKKFPGEKILGIGKMSKRMAKIFNEILGNSGIGILKILKKIESEYSKFKIQVQLF